MRHRQSGNVLFLILIAVALFAALTYAVTSSSRSGNGNVSKEKAALSAAAILQYETAVRLAFQRMRVSGCADTEYSFETPLSLTWSGFPARYINPSSPPSKKCHFFAAAGGGLLAPVLNANYFTVFPNIFSIEGYGYVFTGSFAVPGVGRYKQGDNLGTSPDLASLAVLLPYLTYDICKALNDKLDINDTLTSAGGWATSSPAPPKNAAGSGFGGVYGGYPTSINATSHPAFNGRPTGCYYAQNTTGIGTEPGIYIFYDIILPR